MTNNWHNKLYGVVEFLLSPVISLILRAVVALPFFQSGINKLESWDSTLYLFEEEYRVPILNFKVAAYTGTFTELVFPVLLILGIFTRFSASILFVFNIIAVISYPVLTAGKHTIFSLIPHVYEKILNSAEQSFFTVLKDLNSGINDMAALDHHIWGLVLLILIVFGAGSFSLDKLLRFK